MKTIISGWDERVRYFRPAVPGVYTEKQLMESDPNGRDPKQPGAKLDAGKVAVFQGAVDYFPRAIMAVAEISQFGATKYAWKGWESVPDGFNRYSNAMMRHFMKECMGEDIDPESGLMHAAHAAWGALARLEMKLREHQAN